MELSYDELEKSLEGVGTFRGDFKAIKKEVFEDLEDDSYDEGEDTSEEEEITEKEIKIEIVSRILEENLDFGEWAESLDTDSNRDFRMERRYSLLDSIALLWVEGELSTIKEAQQELESYL